MYVVCFDRIVGNFRDLACRCGWSEDGLDSTTIPVDGSRWQVPILSWTEDRPRVERYLLISHVIALACKSGCPPCEDSLVQSILRYGHLLITHSTPLLQSLGHEPKRGDQRVVQVRRSRSNGLQFPSRHDFRAGNARRYAIVRDQSCGYLGDRTMYRVNPVSSKNRSISVIRSIVYDGTRQSWLADRPLIADCIVRVRMED
jgi:hypothetical protein